jgi:hypothetical protein
LRRELCSADRLRDAAIFFALVNLKTPRLRSSASLSCVTRCDHLLREDFPAEDFFGDCRSAAVLAHCGLAGAPGFPTFGHFQLPPTTPTDMSGKRRQIRPVPMPQCGNPDPARALSLVAGILFAAILVGEPWGARWTFRGLFSLVPFGGRAADTAWFRSG